MKEQAQSFPLLHESVGLQSGKSLHESVGLQSRKYLHGSVGLQSRKSLGVLQLNLRRDPVIPIGLGFVAAGDAQSPVERVKKSEKVLFQERKLLSPT